MTEDANGQVIVKSGWAGRVALLGIDDGTSNTLLFGEKHVRPTGRIERNEGANQRRPRDLPLQIT